MPFKLQSLTRFHFFFLGGLFFSGFVGAAIATAAVFGAAMQGAAASRRVSSNLGILGI